MKVCPKCSAQYEYEMSFCLQDGSPLIISGSTSDVTQVLENESLTEEATQLKGGQSLRTDENTLFLEVNKPELVTGEKTLLMPEQLSAPTEQMNFVKTEAAPPITDNLKVIIPTDNPGLFERPGGFLASDSDHQHSSSRTGLIVGAVLGGFALLATAIGGLIYLNPFAKKDEVAFVNPANSSVKQPANLLNTPSNLSANSVFTSNANSKVGSNISQTQSNANRVNQPPTKTKTDEKIEPTPTKEPPKTPNNDGVIDFNEPPSTPLKTPPNVPKIVSGGVINGKANNLVKPTYPAAARAVRASGAVNVQVTIDENGNVISASAVSGHPLLRSAAESAARSSKFAPTVLSGQKVKVTGVVIYNFVAQ